MKWRGARVGLAIIAAVSGAFALGAAPPADAASSHTVEIVQVQGIVDPPSAQFIRDRLAGAARDGVMAVILQLDTPGGLQVSNDELARAVLEARVPVVAWVAPRGAVAASTGTDLVYAAHVAYVASSTELGPATPATLSGDIASERAGQQALLTRLSQARGRGPGSAPPPVVGDHPVAADLAFSQHYVDGTASSLRELLQGIDGDRVALGDTTRTLETWDEDANAPSVTLSFAQMNLMQRLLHAVTSPEVALMLFLLGLFGFVFELYNPGIGLAAIVGACALLLSMYALVVLPTSWLAILAVAAGVASLVADLQTAGLGPPSALGVTAVAAGSAFAFRGAPAVSLSPWAVATAVVATIVFFVSVMTAALRVRLRRPVDPEEGLVGAVGEAKTDIAPEGTVLTKGTLWRARTMETGIAAGERVEVKATEGAVLLVEPLHELAMPDPHGSTTAVE